MATSVQVHTEVLNVGEVAKVRIRSLLQKLKEKISSKSK
jgi:hypothetical protein